jgi:large subunit ribosomal protein L14
MLQERSLVNIVDNSGAMVVMLFSVTGKNGRRSVSVGDIIKGSVKRASVGGKVKKGDKVSILITGTKRKISRGEGSSIKFSSNFGVVVNSSKDMVGTRVFAPVFRELKDLGFSKVISLAPEVL